MEVPHGRWMQEQRGGPIKLSRQSINHRCNRIMKMWDTLFSDLPNPKTEWDPHYWASYLVSNITQATLPSLSNKYLSVPTSSRPLLVCDPWNGAGTTTQVARDLGYSAAGFDLNPVMVVVAEIPMRDAVPKSSTLGEPSRRLLAEPMLTSRRQLCKVIR